MSVNKGHVNWYLCPLEIIWLDIISPDEKHDQYFVHYVQKSISEYLNSINYYVTVMHEFCDDNPPAASCGPFPWQLSKKFLMIFEYPNSSTDSTKFPKQFQLLYWHWVEEIPRANKRNFKPIKGIRAVHRVETIDSQNLLLRNVSCYCDNCLECEECMNIAQ
jgi:hypothetical protein